MNNTIYVGYANGNPDCNWDEDSSYAKSFKDLNLHPNLLENLLNLKELKLGKHVTPTPIQEFALKPALAKEDINCISATGSGKTMCYAIPIVDHLWKSNVKRSDSILEYKQKWNTRLREFHEADEVMRLAPEAIIMVPTRELTLQVAQTIRKLYQGSEMKCVSFYRDQNFKSKEHRDLQELTKLAKGSDGCNIMVTTLGFVNYMIKRQALDLQNLTHLVFDEADELFNVNFRDDISAFMQKFGFTHLNSAKVPVRSQKFPNCQIMMYSADFDPSIESSSKLFYRDYKTTVKIRSETQRMTQNGRTINTSINELIEQELIEDASNSKKFQHLLGLLDEALPVKVLIFLEAKKSVGPLARRIKSEPQFENITDFLTSDRTQAERSHAVDMFNRGKFQILVATSLGARGLDIKGVSLVINYQLPQCKYSLKDGVPDSTRLATIRAHYIYRIGRTGRTGQTGRFRSVSYFNAKKDEFFAPTLMKYLVDSNSQIPQFFQKIADDARVKEDERQRFLRNNTDKVMAKYMNKLSVDSKGPPACDNDNNNK